MHVQAAPAYSFKNHSCDVLHIRLAACRLDMFDRLLTADPPIVRKTTDGDIIKCMEDYREGFQVTKACSI